MKIYITFWDGKTFAGSTPHDVVVAMMMGSVFTAIDHPTKSAAAQYKRAVAERCKTINRPFTYNTDLEFLANLVGSNNAKRLIIEDDTYARILEDNR